MKHRIIALAAVLLLSVCGWWGLSGAPETADRAPKLSEQDAKLKSEFDAATRQYGDDDFPPTWGENKTKQFVQKEETKMANYVVSGAGSSVNGTYVETGVSNTKPYYRRGADALYIAWAPGIGAWAIATDYATPGMNPYYTGGGVGATPSNSGWIKGPAGVLPVPSVTLQAGDTTPPVFGSASVNTAGTTLTVNLTEAGSPPIIGTTGFSLSGVTGRTLGTGSIAGTVLTFPVAGGTIKSGETPLLSYAPGNVTDSAATPNAMAAFSNQAITNSSTVPNISITSYTPASGKIGSQVVLTGTGFTNITHAVCDQPLSVATPTPTFHEAAFTINSDTQLTLTIPNITAATGLYEVEFSLHTAATWPDKANPAAQTDPPRFIITRPNTAAMLAVF